MSVKQYVDIVTDLGKAVGTTHSVADAAIATLGTLLAYVGIYSPIMRWFCIGGFLGGSVFAYFYTPLTWKGAAKKDRLKRAKTHLLGFLALVILFGLYQSVISVSLAEAYASIADAREVLLRVPLMMNLIALFLMAGMAFCLVTGVTITSSGLDRKSGRQEHSTSPSESEN